MSDQGKVINVARLGTFLLQIKEMFAKKSIYNDNCISLGRKAGTTAGMNSVATGFEATASAMHSHAEGLSTTAGNMGAHAEGESASASGHASHAEGSSTEASGSASHAEGQGTRASGDNAHAEGSGTKAEGGFSHAQGSNTRRKGSAAMRKAAAQRQGTAGQEAAMPKGTVPPQRIQPMRKGLGAGHPFMPTRKDSGQRH